MPGGALLLRGVSTFGICEVAVCKAPSTYHLCGLTRGAGALFCSQFPKCKAASSACPRGAAVQACARHSSCRNNSWTKPCIWLVTDGIGVCVAGLMCGCRESEVLSVFAAIIRRLKQGMESEVPKVLAAVFEPTLQVRACEWCSTSHVCLTTSLNLVTVTGWCRRFSAQFGT
jgi:hypothetical protein